MKRPNQRRLFAAGLVALLMLGGCGPTDVEPDQPTVTYAELAAAHNAAVDRLEQLWVRTVLEARWVDEQGDKHFEQGDGPLIVRKPHELALAIGKLGNTRYWLGADADRYWLFDLSGERRTAYIGRIDRIGNPAKADPDRRALPLPIQPNRLIGLLDITAWPDDVRPEVTATEIGHVFTLPAEAALGGLGRQIEVGPDARARRIALLDADDRVVLEAVLSDPGPVELADAPPGAWPRLAERIEIRLPRSDAKLKLVMRSPTGGADKVRDVQFDFEKLARLHRIERVVDLDEPSEQ